MKINALQCWDCGDTIFSRALHDFRYCSCQAIFVDGGFDEYRRMGGDIDSFRNVPIEVDATKEELFQDWNKETHKYGLTPVDRNDRVFTTKRALNGFTGPLANIFIVEK